MEVRRREYDDEEKIIYKKLGSIVPVNFFKIFHRQKVLPFLCFKIAVLIKADGAVLSDAADSLQ